MERSTLPDMVDDVTKSCPGKIHKHSPTITITNNSNSNTNTVTVLSVYVPPLHFSSIYVPRLTLVTNLYTENKNVYRYKKQKYLPMSKTKMFTVIKKENFRCKPPQKRPTTLKYR